MKQYKLSLSSGNRKIKALSRYTKLKCTSVDILAGVTCPKAYLCKSWVNSTGKISRGRDCQFLCYAARIEAIYPNVYHAHKHNTKLINFLIKSDLFVDCLYSQLHNKYDIVRLHSSGDFFSLDYTKNWINLARALPNIQFFGYTKVYKSYSIIRRADLDNLHVVFSLGSKDDYKAIRYNANTCTVVLPNMKFNQKIVCNGKTDKIQSQDFFEIINNRSFGIKLH